MSIRRAIAIVLIVSLFYSCTTVTGSSLKGYKLPDETLVGADEGRRVEEYEADKLEYGPIPGMFFMGKDMFLQKDLLRREDFALKAALASPFHFTIFPLTKNSYPPDRVVVEDLFRLDEEAYAIFHSGKNMERGEKFGSMVALAGVGTTSLTAIVFSLHFLLFWLTADSGKSTTDITPNFQAYETAMVVGGGLFLGGVVTKTGFALGRHHKYTNAAASYNEYLRELYNLPGESDQPR